MNLNMHHCDKNGLKHQAQVLHEIMEEEGFMAHPAAHHQVAMETFWLQTLMYSIADKLTL